jgi:hypothetical protein
MNTISRAAAVGEGEGERSTSDRVLVLWSFTCRVQQEAAAPMERIDSKGFVTASHQDTYDQEDLWLSKIHHIPYRASCMLQQFCKRFR